MGLGGRGTGTQDYWGQDIYRKQEKRGQEVGWLRGQKPGVKNMEAVKGEKIVALNK